MEAAGMAKSALRRRLLRARQALTSEDWRDKSDRICSHLQAVEQFQSAQTILAYCSIRNEPDLSPLFALTDRQWGLPRCVGKSLVWHRWSPGDPLEKGTYGILEPVADWPEVEPETVDLILVPAVACDPRGYRLGYGGGFYDRLLSLPAWQFKPTIGLVFDLAYLPELPIEACDRKLDRVCTETGLKQSPSSSLPS